MGVFLIESKDEAKNRFVVCDARDGEIYVVKTRPTTAYGTRSHPDAKITGPYPKGKLITIDTPYGMLEIGRFLRRLSRPERENVELTQLAVAIVAKASKRFTPNP